MTVEILDALAKRVNAEHGLAVDAATASVVHAIRAGEALIEARSRVVPGGWHKWMAENVAASEKVCKQYMRIARHKDAVEGFDSITAAASFITATITGPAREARNQEGEARRAHARELRESGMSFKEIADLYGVAERTARWWLAPVAKRKEVNRRNARYYQEAMRALKAKRRESLVRSKGGDVAKAYSQVRLLAQTLAAAAASEGNAEAKVALGSALRKLYGVEEQICRAAGVTTVIETTRDRLAA